MIRMIKYFIAISVVFIPMIALLYILALFPQFDENTDSSLIENPAINQASGLASSLKNSDILWTHNDKTWGKVLFALDTHGKNRGEFYVDNEFIIDSEDVAVGPGPVPGESYIYLADIGDNDRRRDIKSIIRFPEPVLIPGATAIRDTIRHFDVIDFAFPDGRRDAETLMLDPLSRDLFIISKRDEDARVYKLPFPQKTDKLNIAVFLLELPMSLVVAGDISADGSGILIKTYGSVYYWRRHDNEAIENALRRTGEKTSYYLEPQGEAICWAQNQPGYFTTSEELLKIPCRLVYYKNYRRDRFNKLTHLAPLQRPLAE